MRELISDEYQEMLQRMHAEHKFGKSSLTWWRQVSQLLASRQSKTWLDYGCGNGKLVATIAKTSHTMRQRVRADEYDPGVWSRARRPALSNYDLVTCIHTLEHVEPDKLGNVLEDLNRLTGGVLLLVVSTRPAGKNLPDGRNAHLVIEDGRWWQSKVENRGKFMIVRTLPCRDDEWNAILRSSP
jgi:2-polyprenyl-3-methyl-5-hydroxy-6-metoxy-1,4-benzoquinol methylase